MLLDAPSVAAIPLAPTPRRHDGGRHDPLRRATTRRRTGAAGTSIKRRWSGLGAGLALTPLTLLGGLLLGTAALFQSAWLAVVATLFLIATLPFKLGHGHTAMTLLRAASLALLAPLLLFFATAMLRDVQRRVSAIDVDFSGSAQSLSALDLASVAAFNVVRAADLLRRGRAAAANAHAILLVSSETERLWLSDQPMQAPSVRRSIQNTFRGLRQNSEDISVLPETVVADASKEWPGFELISEFHLTGKALRSEPAWRLQLIGSGEFAYPATGTVTLIETDETAVTMPSRLGWAAQQRAWLHPFRARWAWDVGSDDPRLTTARR